MQLQLDKIPDKGRQHPETLVTVPQIPLRIKATLEEYFLTKIEHKQVNEAFIARLKQEQASDEWIQDLKQAIAFPEMQNTPTQNGPQQISLWKLTGSLSDVQIELLEGIPF